MKKACLFLCLLFLISCNSVTTADLTKLNGYWEIETAIMPDGTKKEYTINSTIDYFEIKGTAGIRKKVMPQLDGKYLVNDLQETFTFTEEDGKAYLNYKTEYAAWKEEILELDDEELVVKNMHGIEYHYKKPQPFSIK